MPAFNFNTLLVFVCINLPLFGCTNDTKESILEKPPAAGTSRLPASLQNFVINSTNLDEEATIVDKKLSENIKEVREPPEFEETPRKLIQTTNSSYEPFAKPSNENYIAIGNHKIKSNGNYETGFTPFIPSPLYSEGTISTPFYQDGAVDATFRTNQFKSSAVVKHEHFYSPALSSGYGVSGGGTGLGASAGAGIGTGTGSGTGTGTGANYNQVINLPYSKFNHEKLPQITTFAPPKINPMQRPNLYYKDKKYAHIYAPHQHIEEFGKINDFTSPDFHHNKFASDFHGHNDYLANGPPVEDGFFHNYPKPVYSPKPYHKSHGLWQILATLLPIGLFLSALQPKVIFINSTNPQPPNGVKPAFFRLSDDSIQSTDANVILYNLVANAGLTPSNEVSCNKMKICNAALSGSKSEDQSDFGEYSLWYLVSRSTSSIRKKLHLEDVFEAMQGRQCEQFFCSEETTTQKNRT